MMSEPSVDSELQELQTNISRLWNATSQMADAIALMRDLPSRRAVLLTGTVPAVGPTIAGPLPDHNSRERIVSLSEAARVTGRNHDLLRRWCLQGRLPAIRVGRSWALPESALESLAGRPRRRHRLADGTFGPRARHPARIAQTADR